MRVVAGDLGGRRLEAPRGHDVRPTSDRVRESLFAALDSQGAVAGSRVLDLFAGTGALGIEALSRGAAAVTFVEQQPEALKALSANLAHLGLDADARVEVRRGDALRLVAHLGPFDLVLLDPPYRFGAWPALLEGVGLAADPEAGATVVVETDRRTTPAVPAGWETVREKRYGSTVVLTVQVPGRAHHPPASDGR